MMKLSDFLLALLEIFLFLMSTLFVVKIFFIVCGG